MSYIWRTRNEEGDDRVQTDIIGGAYCVPQGSAPPFVGPGSEEKGAIARGFVMDPRTKEKTRHDIDKKVGGCLA
jgi:hypothetical protein